MGWSRGLTRDVNQSTPLLWRAAIKIGEAAIICSILAIAAPGLAKRAATVVMSIPEKFTKTPPAASSPLPPADGGRVISNNDLPPGMVRMK